MSKSWFGSRLLRMLGLIIPSMLSMCKLNDSKRQQTEHSKRKITERELNNLNQKIDKLLDRLEDHEPEFASSPDEECVICISAKATMQTFPCAHRVVCRRCFVKTIQVAVSQRLLPLRCVVCRTKILRLKQTTSGGIDTGSVLRFRQSNVSNNTNSVGSANSNFSDGNSNSSNVIGKANRSVGNFVNGDTIRNQNKKAKQDGGSQSSGNIQVKSFSSSSSPSSSSSCGSSSLLNDNRSTCKCQPQPVSPPLKSTFIIEIDRRSLRKTNANRHLDSTLNGQRSNEEQQQLRRKEITVDNQSRVIELNGFVQCGRRKRTRSRSKKLNLLSSGCVRLHTKLLPIDEKEELTNSSHVVMPLDCLD